METTPTCQVIHPGGPTSTQKQGIDYFPGISAETTGSRRLCMHLLTIPPGGRARAHLHEGHETTIYVLSGEAVMWYGEGLREKLSCRAGDFLYIPAGTPHLPANLSPTEPCTAVVARTDPSQNESVVLLPDLDAVVDAAIAAGAD